MDQTGLVAAMAVALDLSRKQAEVMIAAVLAPISRALVRGEGVKLNGFGAFELSDRPAWRGRILKPVSPSRSPPAARSTSSRPRRCATCCRHMKVLVRLGCQEKGQCALNERVCYWRGQPFGQKTACKGVDGTDGEAGMNLRGPRRRGCRPQPDFPLRGYRQSRPRTSWPEDRGR